MRNLAYFLPFSSMIDQSSVSPATSFSPFAISSGIVTFSETVF